MRGIQGKEPGAIIVPGYFENFIVKAMQKLDAVKYVLEINGVWKTRMILLAALTLLISQMSSLKVSKSSCQEKRMLRCSMTQYLLYQGSTTDTECLKSFSQA